MQLLANRSASTYSTILARATPRLRSIGVALAVISLQGLAPGQITTFSSEAAWQQSTNDVSIETVESLAVGSVLTNQLSGLTFSSTDAGRPMVHSANYGLAGQPSPPKYFFAAPVGLTYGGGNWTVEFAQPVNGLAFWSGDLQYSTSIGWPGSSVITLYDDNGASLGAFDLYATGGNHGHLLWGFNGFTAHGNVIKRATIVIDSVSYTGGDWVEFDNFEWGLCVNADTDGDGLIDCDDNCDTIANPGQEDCDLDGEGDVCELANGNAKDNNGTGVPDNCEFGLVLSYCTAGTSTHGCLPAMSGTGTPSVTATSGFTVSCTNVEGQKFGLLFYGVTGKQAVVWHQGNSFFCIRTPVQRIPSANSGGTNEMCDGTFSVDFLTYLNNTTAMGEPFSAGDMVWFQTWYRDPPAAGTTNLSNGLQVTMDL